MVKKIKKILHFLGIHDWDNNESAFFQPENIYRKCNLCPLKQQWRRYPPHYAVMTD